MKFLMLATILLSSSHSFANWWKTDCYKVDSLAYNNRTELFEVRENGRKDFTTLDPKNPQQTMAIELAKLAVIQSKELCLSMEIKDGSIKMTKSEIH